jgi:hypothetical protein
MDLFRVDILARHQLQLADDLNIRAMDRTYLVELVRDLPPFWDQTDSKHHNRDLKPG